MTVSPYVRHAPRRTSLHLLNGLGVAAGIGAGLFGYALFHEPLNIELERLSVPLASAVGRLPPQGLRLLHLSDTHFQGRNWREQPKIERIRRLTAGLDYDLLLHTGDFLHYDGGLDNVLALLDALPPPRLGSYAVLGNHDYTHYDMAEALPRMWRSFARQERLRRGGRRASPAALPAQLVRFGRYVRNTPLQGRRTGSNDAARLIAALEARGVTILHNQAVHLRHRIGQADEIDLYLAGIDDVGEGRPHIHHTLDQVPPHAPTILLSHNPDILESPRIGQVDLVLAGHTHGGQIVLPLWGPAHTQAHHLERRSAAGYLRLGDTHVYITRGIGEGIPLRFRARPQLALITVTAVASGDRGGYGSER